jgi:hypothetical protein
VAGYEISRGTLAKIEAQIRGISDVELFVVAKTLAVTIPQLFSRDFPSHLRRGDYARALE